MKPYYDEGGITIYHGDCREVLPTFISPFDLVLVDPPYGIALENHDKDVADLPRGWGIVGDADLTIANYVYRFAFRNQTPLAMFMSPKRRLDVTWREELIWDKGPAVGGGGDWETYFKCCHESIGLLHTRRRGPRDSSVLSNFWITPGDFKLHPAQKPVDLMQYLIDKLTDIGGEVVDPCMGSGTTLVAAKLEGRKAIGIEIEERYCEIAANRLAQGVLEFK